MGGGGKGSSGKAPYEDQLGSQVSGYLGKKFGGPAPSPINIPAMGGLTKQIGAGINIPQYSALKVDPNQFKTLQDIGTEQIAQGARASQQDLLRQFGQRGLGNSGLAAQAAIDQYQRGAAQDTSNLARQLQSQRLGLEFGESQMARGVNAAADQARGQLQLGLGQLGLGEQAQELARNQAQFQQQNYLTPIAAALAQTGIQSATARGSGKGGGKG